MSRSVSQESDQGRDRSSDKACLLDVKAVADLLSCSTRHVYRLADAGRCPKPVKLGSLVRWTQRTGDPQTGVLDWIEAGCRSCRGAGK